MHLEVLVEELSARKAVEILLPKIIGSDHTFVVHDFRDKQDLLGKLESRLRGYSKRNDLGDFRIVVLLDEDRQDCMKLKADMIECARKAGIMDKVLNRIIVEELESWFFGDIEALRKVFPRIPPTLAEQARYRNPDQIPGGTWEALDRLLQQYGYTQGLIKTEAAERIAIYMDPLRNRSKSFQVFREGVLRLVSDKS